MIDLKAYEFRCYYRSIGVVFSRRDEKLGVVMGELDAIDTEEFDIKFGEIEQFVGTV